MKSTHHIVLCLVLLACFACGNRQNVVSIETMQQTQSQYENGFALLQQDSLLPSLPCFFEVANGLERLPEDMTDEEMLLTSKAYFQMAHVFRVKMEHNTEIDALRRALDYQKKVGDTTWILYSSLSLAQAFQVVMEDDSARFYLDQAIPLLDTVSGDPWDYIKAQQLLVTLSLDNQQLDSSFYLQQQLIAFKSRRGMDTKNDSVALGMDLFFSGRHAEAKPYLIKVLEADFGDVERGAILSLLGQVYEEENNADSAAFCNSFNATYVQAESERMSDGMLAVKQYEQFKAERDTRLQALRERKEARKMWFVWGGVALLFVLALSALWAFVAYHRRYKQKTTEWHEKIQRDLQEAHGALEEKTVEAMWIKAHAIYHDKLGHTDRRIIEVFTKAYPNALTKLKVSFPYLTDTDLDICVLAFFGFRVKEMADILDLRENTVAKYRSNLRKKTGTEAIDSLLEPYLS